MLKGLWLLAAVCAQVARPSGGEDLLALGGGGGLRIGRRSTRSKEHLWHRGGSTRNGVNAKKGGAILLCATV